MTLTPRSPRGGDSADKNFRPISTIMPNMNEIHQRVFKIWGLISFNAKTLTLWRKDERTNVRTNVRTNEWMNRWTEKRKLYTPTYFVCRGYKYFMINLHERMLDPRPPGLQSDGASKSLWYDLALDRTHNLLVSKPMLYQLSHCAVTKLYFWGKIPSNIYIELLKS